MRNCSVARGQHCVETRGRVLTLVQDGAPLVVSALVGVGHLVCLRGGGAEEGAEEGDGHARSEGCVACEQGRGEMRLRSGTGEAGDCVENGG